MPDYSASFDRAIRLFGEAHRQDPRQVMVDGASIACSLHYHQRLSHWVDSFPDSSEALRLAAHCQHLRRWVIPRTDFPTGVTGYKRWRSGLAQFHADEASAILQQAGFGDSTVAAVRDLLLKKGIKRLPHMQLFEDAICLTFLEIELVDFAAKHPPEKMVAIIQKTWTKMSPAGHAKALELAACLPASARQLIDMALAGD